jgi:hypothetical protein
MTNVSMSKLGMLATAAALSLAGATASHAQSVIVQEPMMVQEPMAPSQQIITERTVEPGLFGERVVRERTVVTRPMVTEQTVVAPTVIAPAPRTVQRVVEPRYTVTQRAPVYQPGVTTVVSEPAPAYEPAYRPAYWNDYGYVNTTQCSVGFDGFRRCY